MRRFMVLVTAATLMMALLFPAGAASAQQQADPVVVEVGPTANLLDDGQAVRVKVKVECQPPAEVLEAHLTVSQEEGASFGQSGIASVVCDGKKRTHWVTVQALDSTFSRGEARVSAFVLVCLDEACTETAQGQDSRVVRVVGS